MGRTAKTKDEQREGVIAPERVDAGLLEDDFEYQPREDLPDSLDLDSQDDALRAERNSGAQNPTGFVGASPSSKQNPYMSEEEQGMEMSAKTFGPPQYGSPDPATASSRLLTLEDGHPLDMVPEDHPAAISSDYAQDVLGTATDDQRHAAGDFSVENNAAADATPAARDLANENSVDLSQVEGTGENGRITKDDVDAYLAEREEDANNES